MFRTVPLSIIRSFSLYTEMVYVIQVCWQLASRIRMEPVWHITLLCVQWKAPDDGQRNCPKHVGFYSKNKFEKLVHLVSFIIRIYHDARSPERQTCAYCDFQLTVGRVEMELQTVNCKAQHVPIAVYIQYTYWWWATNMPETCTGWLTKYTEDK